MVALLIDKFNNLNNWTNQTSTSNPAGMDGNCLKIGTTLGQADYVLSAADQTDVLDVDFWLNVNSVALANSCLQFLADSSATAHMNLRMATTGAIDLMRGGTGGTILGSSATGVLVANTWTHIRVRTKLADVGGTYDLWVSGNHEVSGSGDTKQAGTALVYDTVRFFTALNNTLFVQIDEAVIDNGKRRIVPPRLARSRLR